MVAHLFRQLLGANKKKWKIVNKKRFAHRTVSWAGTRIVASNASVGFRLHGEFFIAAVLPTPSNTFQIKTMHLFVTRFHYSMQAQMNARRATLKLPDCL